MSRVSSWNTKHRCISGFFEHYPTPSSFAAETQWANVKALINPLGLFDDRLQSLVALTTRFLDAEEFACHPDRKSPHKIRGIGAFGYESWLVFCKDMGATLKLSDGGKPLAPFVAWRRRVEAGKEKGGAAGAEGGGECGGGESGDDVEVGEVSEEGKDIEKDDKDGVKVAGLSAKDEQGVGGDDVSESKGRARVSKNKPAAKSKPAAKKRRTAAKPTPDASGSSSSSSSPSSSSSKLSSPAAAMKKTPAKKKRAAVKKVPVSSSSSSSSSSSASSSKSAPAKAKFFEIFNTKN